MRTVIPIASVLLLASSGAQEWRDKFSEVYRLDEGQCLKRIAPPFIPELLLLAGQARAVGQGWTDQKQQSLAAILEFVLSMKTYDYELPKDIAKLKLDGDWIVVPDADPQKKLDALCAIIKSAEGPSIRFTQKELPRNVLVANGEFVSHPLENIHHPNWIHLYVGTPDKDEGAGGGSGDLKAFLEMLGSRTRMQVIDEVAGDRPKELHWGHHCSTNFRELAGLPEGKDRDEKIEQLLKLVTQQTEIQFKKELRMVSVWVAEPVDTK